MTRDQRESMIQTISNMMSYTPFQVEFKVAKRPKGIKVIIEVTKEEMAATMENYKNQKAKEL